MTSKNKKGFSLAESLISLLIVSLILAATMPVITVRKKTGGEGYWMSDNNANVYYAIAGNTKVGIGTNTPTAKTKVDIRTTANDNVGLAIQRFSSSQTANLLEFRNEDGTQRLSYVDASGNFSGQTPAGAVMYFYTPSCPDGWQEANGDPAGSAALIAASGGKANVPDLRGLFIRSWNHDSTNDPDAASRTGGNAVGSIQADAMQNIYGTIYTESYVNADGAFAPMGGGDGGYKGPGDTPSTITFDASRVVRTSTETRPRNVALLACIKK